MAETKNGVPRFPIATVVEVSVIGVFPASDYPKLQLRIEEFQNELRSLFEREGGRDANNRWAEVRQATREEVLHFVPRKVHYSSDGTAHACDTKYVARRNLTRNPEEVTCKLCKRALGLTEAAR